MIFSKQLVIIRTETEDLAEYNPPERTFKMKQRVISAFLGLIVLIIVLLGNQTVFDVAVTLIATVGIYEVISAVGMKQHKILMLISLLMPLSLMSASYFFSDYLFPVLFVFLILFLLIMLFNHKRYTFSKIAMAFTASVMVSVPFLFVSMTRRLGNGNLDVLVILIGCWITDSCAYFTGYFLGKHKLAPEISPKKTIEGSIGGVLGVIGILVAYAYIVGNIMNITANLIPAAIIGLVAGIISQFGDLCASIIKREHGIKDFGKIMPGHGGVMDRFDSLIFVAPAVYYILTYFPIFVK